jgi:hypothetical protein
LSLIHNSPPLSESYFLSLWERIEVRAKRLVRHSEALTLALSQRERVIAGRG